MRMRFCLIFCCYLFSQHFWPQVSGDDCSCIDGPISVTQGDDRYISSPPDSCQQDCTWIIHTDGEDGRKIKISFESYDSSIAVTIHDGPNANSPILQSCHPSMGAECTSTGEYLTVTTTKQQVSSATGNRVTIKLSTEKDASNQTLPPFGSSKSSEHIWMVVSIIAGAILLFAVTFSLAALIITYYSRHSNTRRHSNNTMLSMIYAPPQTPSDVTPPYVLPRVLSRSRRRESRESDLSFNFRT